MLSPWLGVIPVVGVVTVVRAATSRGGKKRRDDLHARDDRYGSIHLRDGPKPSLRDDYFGASVQECCCEKMHFVMQFRRRNGSQLCM